MHLQTISCFPVVNITENCCRTTIVRASHMMCLTIYKLLYHNQHFCLDTQACRCLKVMAIETWCQNCCLLSHLQVDLTWAATPVTCNSCKCPLQKKQLRTCWPASDGASHPLHVAKPETSFKACYTVPYCTTSYNASLIWIEASPASSPWFRTVSWECVAHTKTLVWCRYCKRVI